MYHFFAYISRMRYIARWGLMRNTIPENIQEHSHMVAVLAHALAVIRRDVFGGEINAEAVATAALFHDAPEILTGDLPTPIKYYNPEISSAYHAVEAVSAAKLLSLLPDCLRPSYEPLITGEDPDIHVFVKAADKIAAYIKCLEELKAGNTEFRQAAQQIKAVLDSSPLPEVSYFMEHFMPGFELSLDELNETH